MIHPGRIFFVVLMTLFWGGQSAWSYPVQYTLEGFVIQGPGINDSAGFLADMGISIGSHVSYSIVIDLNSTGTILLNNGTLTNPLDVSGKNTFYAHYAGSSTITSSNHLSSYNGIQENNYGGNNWLTSTFSERWLSISNGNNYLDIYNMFEQPNSSGEWSIGFPWAFGAAFLRNTIFDSSGNSSYFNFVAQITKAESIPIPEPSTFALFGVGLAGNYLFRKRYRK
ncbi:PEP-CTERM sorting domain-containing protein [Geobacter anodireducens]